MGDTLEPDGEIPEIEIEVAADEIAANDAAYRAAFDRERNQREWGGLAISAITELTGIGSNDGPLEPRVRFAIDRARIAAAERLTRLLNSDMEEPGDDG